jgi:tryptophan halogenase
MTASISRVIIAGGGTAGWMAAISLARFKTESPLHITLVESSQIGTVGVGEATIPGIVHFNRKAGLNELDFIKATQASFKLGIQFENWYQHDSKFFHPFADFGMPVDGVAFHHYLNRLASTGVPVNYENYSFACILAQQNKFAQPNPQPQSPLADYSYAYHFDASLYAAYLKQQATAAGVKHIDAEIAHVMLKPDNGFIESLVLKDGTVLEGDLFIDCSGFRSLLLGQALGVGYQSWQHWLLCDGAFAVQTTRSGEILPYTRSIAMDAGWQWRIPLQHRMGNGHIFSSAFCTDEQARQTLLDTVEGEVLTEPRKLSFTPGRRDKIWHKNCFALGLASGFLEPLESTSISLVQTALAKLEAFFPSQGFAECDITEVNRLHNLELEQIRDFLILHYKLTGRRDTEFWRHCADMTIPDSLAHKIELYRHRGHVALYDHESFKHSSWLAMYNGFRVLPQQFDAKAAVVPLDLLQQKLSQMRESMETAAMQADSHQTFINRHCPAPKGR